MDAELLWTALGTVVACMALALAWYQMRSQKQEVRDDNRTQSSLNPTGIPVLVPTGRLPVEVRGRDRLLTKLQQFLRKPPGYPVILAGTGGMGKSTVAANLAERVQDTRIGWRRPLVWWVAAGDRVSLSSALVTVAEQLGATPADIEAIGNGMSCAPDRLWTLLERVRRRSWLLIFDNADDSAVLACPRAVVDGETLNNTGSTADGTGWLRPAKHGLVLVTSRNSSRDAWGRHSIVLPIDQLNENDAAQVLLDLAPHAGDVADARRLAARLGCLPLALRMAGSYLGSGVALRPSFDDYLLELDDHEARPHLLDIPPNIGSTADRRSIVMYTWEISLDALARAGVVQARPLLRLLSCYAANTPIPIALLSPRRLVDLLSYGTEAEKRLSDRQGEHRLTHGLHHLDLLSLIEVIDTPPFGGVDGGRCAVMIHPVIADTNRAHLLDESTEDANAAMIHRIAIELMIDVIERLDYDGADDWPHFRTLGPHLHALIDIAAHHVGRTELYKFLLAAIAVGRAYNGSGALPMAHRVLERVLDFLDRLGEEASLLSAATQQELAWTIATQGHPMESEVMYRDVLTINQQILGEEHPHTLRTRHELAWIAGVQGRWAEAEAAYRDVLDARRRVLGEEHPDTLLTHHELAWTIANQDREEEAEPILLEIATVRRRVLGAEHHHTLMTRHELGWVTAGQGRWAEAEAVYRDVLDARRRILGEEHHHTLTTRYQLAWTMAAQERTALAISEYQAVLDARRCVLGEDHPDTIEIKESLRKLRSGQLTRPRHPA